MTLMGQVRIGVVVFDERLQGADEVTVHFGRSRSAVKVYDPTAGTEAVQTTGSVESLKLSVSDHPLIISFLL